MTTTKRIDYLLLGSSWLVLLVFLGIIFIPDNSIPMLKAHPDYPPMTQSVHQITQDSVAYPMAIGLAFSIILIMGILAIMGNRKHGEWGKISYWLIGGLVLYAFAWGIMIWTHYGYQTSGDHRFWGGFPLPTAWMIYVIWFLPILPMAAYFFLFKSWIWRDQDETRFQELVQNAKDQSNG